MRLALQCKAWGSLPEPGGLLDQPFGLLEKMQLVYNVFMAVKGAVDSQDLIKWADANPDQYRTYIMVRELELDAN